MSVYDRLTFTPMFITELFKPHKGKRLTAAHREPGHTLFVGGSELHNSVTDMSDVEPLFPGGWLTLTYNGSIGQTRYQPVPFYASDDVIALEPLYEEATKPALLVLATLIQHVCVDKFSYAVKLNLSRLRRQKTMVPTTTDDDGNAVIDWEGMTALGEELFARVDAQLESVYETTATDNVELPELMFTPMFISDVFDSIEASSAWYDKNKLEPGTGPFPYVSRTGNSNGYENFITKQSLVPNPGNAVTIGVDTQTVFYQPVPFYTSVKIQVLRHPLLNRSNGLILVTLLKAQMSKFQWGNGVSLRRLRATRIMVPVARDDHGQTVPDWEGMTAYGQIIRSRVERNITASANNLFNQTQYESTQSLIR